ncbi:MAG: BspA family leucine-rich repeat surface protein, partial [Spirochaetota bacterium]
LLLYLVPTLIFLASCEDPKSSTPFSNTPFSKQELQRIVQSKIAAGKQEELKTLDTSYITDMSGLFAGMTDFNTDISGWNTSRVTDMSHMFSGATSFNQNLGKWKTGSVTNMAGMFRGATNFGLNNFGITSSVDGLSASIDRSSHGSSEKSIGDWDTSNVEDMSYMFAETFNFDVPLVGSDDKPWSFQAVTTTKGMFKKAKVFNQVIKLDAPNLEDVSGMFEGAGKFNQKPTAWKTPAVRYAKNVFKDTVAFNQPVAESADTQWELPQAEDISGMFQGAKAFNKPLKEWKTPEVKVAKDVFKNAKVFGSGSTGKVEGWEIKQAEDTSGMFEGAKQFGEDLTGWQGLDNTKLKKTTGMFADSGVTTAKLPNIGRTALAAPTGLTAGVSTGDSLALTWEAVAGAEGYQVYYIKKFLASGKEFKISEAGVRSQGFATAGATVGGLEGFTDYYFRVTATGSKNWDSPPSTGVGAKTKARQLAAPRGLKASELRETSLKISWEKIGGAAGYAVYYSKTEGDLNNLTTGWGAAANKTKGKKTKAQPSSGSTVSLEVGGLVGFTEYHFKVVALAGDAALNSAPSSVLSQKTALA